MIYIHPAHMVIIEAWRQQRDDQIENLHTNLQHSIDFIHHSHQTKVREFQDKYNQFILYNLVEDTYDRSFEREHFTSLAKTLKRPAPFFPTRIWRPKGTYAEVRIPVQKRFEPVIAPLIVASGSLSEAPVTHTKNTIYHYFTFALKEFYEHWKESLHTDPHMRKALKIDLVP